MYKKNYQTVLKETDSSLKGLSSAEAEKRLKTGGLNKLTEKKKKSAFVKFLSQFKNTMVIVLICAAFLSAAISFVKGDPGELADTAIILVIVVLNALIGFIQENKAEKAVEALKKLSLPFSKVLRDGQIKKIKSEELVVGDIVVLEAGDIVPADLRLTEASNLKIQESALTGESLPSEKNVNPINHEVSLGDRHNMAFSSGVVSYGRGQGVITATGMNTEIGKIAAMLTDTKEIVTPLQKKLNKTGKVISIGVIIIAVTIFIAGLFTTAAVQGNLYIESLMRAIAIAVAAIPEGLPAVVTIVMALGMQALSQRRAIIKNLPAVETLGCTEIICSDKTGTLTLNKMTVKEKFVFGQGIQNNYAELYNCMVLCNDACLSEANGKIETLGDPTETALLEYAYNNKIVKSAHDKLYKRVREIPFDSSRKRMSVVVENQTGQKRTVYTKGAIDELIKICTNVLENGRIREMTGGDREIILKTNHNMASNALRVLGYAFSDKENPELESGLTFIGMTGMIDPPRPEVKEAVRVCKNAGMVPIMITGDHKDTAIAIAKELNIIKNEKEVLTGKELDLLSDNEFKRIIHNIHVYARVSPENKVRIVKTWRSLGKVVAMTGDGVNDAPSIKAADIGIGMGITGTDITKSVADMVLADDNFATIIVAVEEGRKVYSNIQKSIQFLLSANIAEVLSLFIITVFFRHLSFLLPIHLLWINLVTDSLPALALGMERAEKDIMNYPPRKAHSNMFKGALGVNIIYQGVLQTAIILSIFFFGLNLYGNAVAVTMAFVCLCFIQLYHAYNARSERHSIFSIGVFKNFLMNLSFIVGIGLTYLIVAVPFLGQIFGTSPLSFAQWFTVFTASMAIIPMVEIVKVITRLIIEGKENKKTREKGRAEWVRKPEV